MDPSKNISLADLKDLKKRFEKENFEWEYKDESISDYFSDQIKKHKSQGIAELKGTYFEKDLLKWFSIPYNKIPIFITNRGVNHPDDCVKIVVLKFRLEKGI